MKTQEQKFTFWGESFLGNINEFSIFPENLDTADYLTGSFIQCKKALLDHFLTHPQIFECRQKDGILFTFDHENLAFEALYIRNDETGEIIPFPLPEIEYLLFSDSFTGSKQQPKKADIGYFYEEHTTGTFSECLTFLQDILEDEKEDTKDFSYISKQDAIFTFSGKKPLAYYSIKRIIAYNMTLEI